MKVSTVLAAANVAPCTNVAASKIPLSDREAAERFSTAVLAFSAGDLARAAHRTKNAAKGWKDASRAPGASALLNMARSLPEVRAFIDFEIGFSREAQAGSVDAVLRALYGIAARPDAEGVRARGILAVLNRADEQPRETAAIHDLFERRR